MLYKKPSFIDADPGLLVHPDPGLLDHPDPVNPYLLPTSSPVEEVELLPGQGSVTVQVDL